MAVSKEDIRVVAHLARLEFEEVELDAFTTEFNSIVTYVDQLKELNTTGVEPMAHALPLHNVFRDDVVTSSLPVDQALANAPARQSNFYSVPAVHD